MKRLLLCLVFVVAGCSTSTFPEMGNPTMGPWTLACFRGMCVATTTLTNNGRGCVTGVWGLAFAATPDAEIRTNGDDPFAGVQWYAPSGVLASGASTVVTADGWEIPDNDTTDVLLTSDIFWDDVACH